ncbi:MAG: MFS transporter [Candidatus Thorarchaeota archaeon]
MTELKQENIGLLESLKIVFRSRNFVVILLTNYTGSFFFAAWIYFNLFFRDIGISYFELGIANAFFFLIAMFATLFGGFWADRHGGAARRLMATFNKFFIGIAALLLTLVNDIYGLLIVWTIFGLGQFCQAAIDPILFESIPPKQMGIGTSLFTVGGIFSILGLVSVGVLIQGDFVEGLRLFFLLTSISSFVDFLIRFKFLKVSTNHFESPPARNPLREMFGQYRTGLNVFLVTIPLFALVFFIDVISDTSFQFAQNFYLNETVQMSYTAINYTMIGASCIGVIGGLVAGRLLDRTENEAKIMFQVYFLLPFSVLLLYYSPIFSQWITLLPGEEVWQVISSTAFIAVVIKSGNDVVWRTVAWGAVGRQLPREHTGKVMAMLAMVISFVGFISSPIIGFIYQTQGGEPLLLVSFVLNVTILLLLLFGWIRSSKSVQSHAEPKDPLTA